MKSGKSYYTNSKTTTVDGDNKTSYIPPPPFMIFSSKLKVCQSHSDESSDNQQNNKDDEEYAVDGINSVAPDTSKNVVQLYVDGTEREKSCHCHLGKGTPIPRQRWNFSGIFCSADRCLELSFAIFTSNTTQDK